MRKTRNRMEAKKPKRSCIIAWKRGGDEKFHRFTGKARRFGFDQKLNFDMYN